MTHPEQASHRRSDPGQPLLLGPGRGSLAGPRLASRPAFLRSALPVPPRGLFTLVHPSILTVQIAQSIAGLASLALLVLAVRRAIGPAAALVAGFLFTLYGPALAMENEALMESLLLLFAAAALWLWPAPGRGPLAHLGFGLACGLLAAGRGSFLLLPVLAVAGLAVFERRPRGMRSLATAAALVAAGTLLPLGPQIVA